MRWKVSDGGTVRMSSESEGWWVHPGVISHDYRLVIQPRFVFGQIVTCSFTVPYALPPVAIPFPGIVQFTPVGSKASIEYDLPSLRIVRHGGRPACRGMLLENYLRPCPVRKSPGLVGQGGKRRGGGGAAKDDQGIRIFIGSHPEV